MGQLPSFADQPIAEVIKHCRNERYRFIQEQESESAACSELFWRALKGNDQGAWSAIYEQFKGLIYHWINDSQFADPDDILQEAWSNFYHYAPKNQELVESYNLSRYLKYLFRCVKTVIIRQAQNEPKQHLYLDINNPVFADITLIDTNQLNSADEHQLTQRLIELSHNEQERLVFILKFIYEYKPREILDRYQQRFQDIQEINKIIQRLVRRFQNDPIIQQYNPNLVAEECQNRAPVDSLTVAKFSSDTEAEDTLMGQPCSLTTDVLLDYVLGLASPTIQAQISASTACQAAARSLAQRILPFRWFMHSLSCPDPEQLLAYQEKLLTTTPQLIVYAHIKTCPLCQDILVLLDHLDQRFEPPQPTFALFRKPLSFGLRGASNTIWDFETPRYWITLRADRQSLNQQRWDLAGQIRLLEDRQLAAHELQALTLRSITDPNHTFSSSEPQAARFRILNIPAGHYTLEIMTIHGQIILEAISIEGVQADA
ncbi:sigma-70 family RNA polymerase sigma factor [Herpetosiphon gulosus]|uniref:Uncharacterized protein n=1 Tax=Herpetosiphon gulosus TaxID=1973496 RepID=A0ABP9X6M5_9CHLR